MRVVTPHWLDRPEHQWLVRLRPRAELSYCGQGRTVFAAGLDGMVSGGKQGLFAYQTRLLSRYRYLINEKTPEPIALSNVEQHSWLGYYGLMPPGAEDNIEPPGAEDNIEEKSIAQHTLELRVSRYVGGGVHEDLDLTNFTRLETKFWLEIEIDADFADLHEIEAEQRQQQGELRRSWQQDPKGKWGLSFDYTAEHQYDVQGNRGTARLDRGVVIGVDASDTSPECSRDRIRFPVRLGARESWHACLSISPVIDGKVLEPAYGCRSFFGTVEQIDRNRHTFLSDATRFIAASGGELSFAVGSALEQAKRDLAALRLDDLRHGSAWTMAAGLPVYLALFGRDTLTAAWQAALTGPEMMQGTLAELARWQGKEINDWRDEQPGRMLHEAQTGPLAMLNYTPRARYYGAATTSAFYPVIVSELWHWTGDKESIRSVLEPARKALRWLDEYGDNTHDGFYDYRCRSIQGNANQGWKDSGDAMVYEDGSQVAPPIATCEEQAFVYAAKLQMSEVLWWLDEKDAARRLYQEAEELKKRFHEAFWMEELGCYAMALDPQGRQVRSIASDPGHCIAAGIVQTEAAKPTADRLLADDMFSGWGVRTLSSAHPAYNPYSYHRGSIWPVEQGTFALGMMRYGLHEHMHRICRAQFEAASLFDFYRLPELFAGHQRDHDHPFPAMYPNANWPQAWSSSQVFTMLQAMLGLYPYAPLHLLIVDPVLPDWLPEITLNGLRVGGAIVDLRFYRTSNGNSSYEVLNKRGHLHVLRQPSPWSLTAGFAERVVDVLTSMLPGK